MMQSLLKNMIACYGQEVLGTYSSTLMKHLRILVPLTLAVSGIASPVLAQGIPRNSERPIGQWALTLIVSTLASCLTGFMAANARLKEFQSKTEFLQTMEKKRREEKNRIQYLNPLRISADDLLRRLEELNEKTVKEIEEQDKSENQKDSVPKCLESFTLVNEHEVKNRPYFDNWCNIEGYYAMSTLYITSVYFFRANKLRAEFPAAQLDPSQDEKLLQLLSEIRVNFGKQFGIWEIIQDSIGAYIRRMDGSLMNYKEFCELVADPKHHVWFRSLIDFYVSFDKKINYEVSDLRQSLPRLVDFLASMQNVKKPSATAIQRLAIITKEIFDRLNEVRHSHSAVLNSGPKHNIKDAENSEKPESC